MIRVGVVGCGYWGAKHVRVLTELTEVSEIVVVDRDVRLSDQLAAMWPGVRASTDLDPTLGQVDAVVVATPTHLHGRIALEAIRLGRHVLVEKPMAASVAEAEQMVREAEAAGVVLMCGHTFEYHPAVWQLRDAVAQGHFGSIHFIHSVRLNLGPVRREVDVIADLATHDISISNYVLDSRPSRVTGWSAAHTHAELADTATLRLDYDEVAVSSTLRVSWLDPCKVRRTTIVGDRLMAVFDDLDPSARLSLFDRGIEENGPGSPITYRNGVTVVPTLLQAEPLLLEVHDFVRAVIDRRPPHCDGRRALDVVRIVAAAHDAVRSARTVRLTWPQDPRSTAAELPAVPGQLSA